MSLRQKNAVKVSLGLAGRLFHQRLEHFVLWILFLEEIGEQLRVHRCSVPLYNMQLKNVETVGIAQIQNRRQIKSIRKY